MNVLIVDDEQPARENLKRHLSAYAELVLVGEAQDGDEADSLIEQLEPDVVFLDIQMPGRSGLSVASECGTKPLPLFVFVTAYDAYALKAFDLNAVDYLLKPFDATRIERMMLRLKGMHSLSEAAQRSQRLSLYVQQRTPVILLPEAHELTPVAVTNIVRIEAAKDWVAVILENKQTIVRKTLSAMLALLGADFVQVHRSHIVNVSYVDHIEARGKGDHILRLKNGDHVPMSRRYSDKALGRFGTLI